MIQEKEIIQRIQQGELELFAQIISNHQKLVYFSILKMLHGHKAEAEDITQEVFISAYRSINHFRQDSSLSTWLLRIATNKALDYKRKKQLDTVSDVSIIEKISGTHDPLKELLDKESRTNLQTMILKLPEPYRVVIDKYYIQNMSYKEISTLEGVEIKTIESRLYRARHKLKSLWKEDQKYEV